MDNRICRESLRKGGVDIDTDDYLRGAEDVGSGFSALQASGAGAAF
jgi:hypothetical protein